jgi:hypothetical protein
MAIEQMAEGGQKTAVSSRHPHSPQRVVGQVGQIGQFNDFNKLQRSSVGHWVGHCPTPHRIGVTQRARKRPLHRNHLVQIRIDWGAIAARLSAAPTNRGQIESLRGSHRGTLECRRDVCAGKVCVGQVGAIEFRATQVGPALEQVPVAESAPTRAVEVARRRNNTTIKSADRPNKHAACVITSAVSKTYHSDWLY